MRKVTSQTPISLADLLVINLRPSFGNRSRAVDNLATRERITEIVRRLVQR
jgi:hypothetical protein